MEISTNLGNAINSTYDYMNTNPIILIIIIIVILSYIIFFSNISGNIDTNIDINTNIYSNWLIIFMISLFVFLVIINGFQYFFHLDIIATIRNIFTPNPEIDIKVDMSQIDKIFDEPKPKPKPKPKVKMFETPQVFNIPGNNYNYYDAKALCKAYGSKLATYAQLEEAYEDGADWCNYGWSDNQMALYPTQMEKWKRLQKIEGHENDCGRPGINGGYIANPAIRFGVNCYGIKPRMTEKEEELMATQPLYPKTKKDIAMENRVNFWKNKLDEVLVSPFNHQTWSRI
jgi:hypothetical protein